MRSSKHGDRPGAQARFRPWRWPEGDAELPSNSAARRRRWRRRSRSRSPTATAKLTCRSPSSRERLLQTLNGGAERWNLSFSASAHTHTHTPSQGIWKRRSSGTHLSRRTTPSMQAPNRITLDMSEQSRIRTATPLRVKTADIFF